jgi:imidazolonepropionase-like amidohydrolase
MCLESTKWTVNVAASLILFAAAAAAQTSEVKAVVGARLIDGSGKPAIENAVLVLRDGRVAAVGPASATQAPPGAHTIKMEGKTIIPGLVNAHAHVTFAQPPGSGPPAGRDIARQLELYARYGVTSIWSLGGEDAAAVKARDSQETPALTRARIYFAGPVITGKTTEEARKLVGEVAAMKPDVIKIRVDDNLGSARKMAPEVYRAVIDESHRLGYRVAAHIYYLDDAKALLRAGADFIAHSVRDREVDSELASLLKQRDVCYCPTFTRELSTYVYETTPPFFKDPFFLRAADMEVVRQLQEPGRQAEIRASKSAQTYKAAVPLAMRNLKKLADAGVRIAMGTDSGAAPGRFQGYFEHLELEMMAEAGLTPAQVLQSATANAAACMERGELIGRLERGRWADFVVLDEDPLRDIRNTRKIHSVWIAGNRVDISARQ